MHRISVNLTNDCDGNQPNFNHDLAAIGGWGSKFGTAKCRMAEISKIRNFKY